jgi:hypothetical protein
MGGKDVSPVSIRIESRLHAGDFRNPRSLQTQVEAWFAGEAYRGSGPSRGRTPVHVAGGRVVLAKGGVVPPEPEMPRVVSHRLPTRFAGTVRSGTGVPGQPFSQRLNDNAPATPSDRQNHRGAQTALAGQSERFGAGSGPTKRALLISNVGVPQRESPMARRRP